MATRIQLRRGTAAQWTSANPVLAAGEIGTETDTGKLKVGDGTSTWSVLSYIQGEGSSSSWGSLTGSLAAQTDLAAALAAKQSTTEKGVASGYASLDSSGLVPAAQLQVALTETRGITRYATAAETMTGTETSAAVTPYGLAQSGLIPGPATTSAAGTLSAADKAKLDGIPSPAASDSGKVLGVDSAGVYVLGEPTGGGGSLVLTLAHSVETQTTMDTSYDTLYEGRIVGRKSWHSSTLTAYVVAGVTSGASGRVRLAVSDGSTTVTAESDSYTTAGTLVLAADTSTLTDDAAWTIQVDGKVTSGGTVTISRIKVTADPVDALSPPLAASGAGGSTNGTTWADLAAATILPTALQPDGRAGVILSGAVTLTGATEAEIRVTVSGIYGGTTTSTTGTLAITASGCYRIDVPYPAIAAPVMTVTISGRITAGTGTLALPTWQLNMEQ